MRKPELTHIFLSPIIELIMIAGVFLLAYQLRGITDGIPFVQLRIPYISYEQFFPFILSGVLLWGVVFASGGLYTIRDDYPIFEEIRVVLQFSFFWVVAYMSFVYISTGFLFIHEIPRLIIFYVYIFSTIFSILIRSIRHTIYGILYKKSFISKKHILVIFPGNKIPYEINESITAKYTYDSLNNKDIILSKIREGTIDVIISLSRDTELKELKEILELSRIYGIPFAYPKFLPEKLRLSTREGFIGNMPIVEIVSVSISAWGRILKRTIDIFGSLVGLIILAPLFIIISIIIKIEDPSGPVFFANRRMGQGGKIFSLYKFRYMYWKYSVKDAYGIDPNNDSALKYEEKLKEKNDTREGPLYKIKDDPRKMKFGKIIERISLDELPQLYNVLIGNMSLIGPRPHQPREVSLYDEEDKQVLTVKPGITGMAQVYGRETNTFKDEVRLDTFYIENYSLGLDIAILLRTIGVVFMRIWQ